MKKQHADVNDTLRDEGIEAVRGRHDNARKFNRSSSHHNENFKPDDEPTEEGVSLRDFHAYMPMHNYIYAPTREPWPAASVNARIPPIPLVDQNGKPVLDEKTGNQKTISASAWLDRNQPVEQMSWAPGLPMLIRDRLISDGGWIERQQVTCLNLYRPPIIKAGNPAEAGPWIEHVHKVFGDDAKHITAWLAQRVQCPHDKINHALVLGGASL